MLISLLIMHNTYHYLIKQKRYKLYSMSLFYVFMLLVIVARMIQACLLYTRYFYNYFVFMSG